MIKGSTNEGALVAPPLPRERLQASQALLHCPSAIIDYYIDDESGKTARGGVAFRPVQ